MSVRYWKTDSFWGFPPPPPRFKGCFAPNLLQGLRSALWPHWARPQIHNPPFKILDLPLCSRNYSHNDKFTLLGSKVFKLDTSLTLQIWHRPNLPIDIMPILKLLWLYYSNFNIIFVSTWWNFSQDIICLSQILDTVNCRQHCMLHSNLFMKTAKPNELGGDKRKILRDTY